MLIPLVVGAVAGWICGGRLSRIGALRFRAPALIHAVDRVRKRDAGLHTPILRERRRGGRAGFGAIRQQLFRELHRLRTKPITKAEFNDRFNSSMISKTCWAVCSSRLPVGSSANTHGGSVTKARATAAR